MMTALAKALRALLWCALAAEVAWLTLSALAGGALSAVLDAEGRALAHLLVLCALALSSGLLLALERRASTAEDPEREWTLAETLYSLALFGSLFFGAYAFFGWYYSP
jgi:hypothetical protein